MDLADIPRHRPLAFDKMEALIKEMQDPETGVPVRSQKIFLSLIPSAFMGYDLVEWLMDRFNLDEASNVEAINLGNQLCQHGYFFPVNDLKNLVLKDDSSLYRFQSPYYWPWTGSRVGAALGPDNVEYAIYLVKRTLRNKQRHALDDYEQEALANLRRNLAAKWDFITMQAEEQVRLAKDRKKGDKIVSDSQERAYWRVARPPPGVPSALEPCPVPVRARQAKPRRRTAQHWLREIELLKASLDRTRVKASVALEALINYSETFTPYDPWLTPPQPSNPWISDDTLFWQINSPLVDVPSEKRVQRWALSIEELVSDPTGLQEFTSFLRKEYSHENIRFWLAVMDLRRSSAKAIPGKLHQIYEEFLKPGAPCEINIDGATAEKVAENIKGGSRYALDHAADHVYNLLLKKDCYPRFIRSDHFQRLLAEGRNVHQKKKFFNFGGQVKKKPGASTSGAAAASSALSRRRGSDRSLSGSAHELALCAAQPPRPTEPPPHSHSQSNLADLRDPSTLDESGDEVAPWESCGRECGGARRRQDSAADSGSSSSDLSAAVGERRRLPQQSTLDGGLRGAPPPLRRLSAVEPRHLPPPASPPRPACHPPPPAAPHPTPTISVSSAPDDDHPDTPPEERDDPPSVFTSAAHTPVNEPDKTLCDNKSESSEVSEPVAGCSRDAPRTIAREPTIKETSPASSKHSSIADLPGIPPDICTVVLDPVDTCQPGPSEEAKPLTALAIISAPEASSAVPVALSSTLEPSPAPMASVTSASIDVVPASDVAPSTQEVPSTTPVVATSMPKVAIIDTSTEDMATTSSSMASVTSKDPPASLNVAAITSNVESATPATASSSVALVESNRAVKSSKASAAMPSVAGEVLKPSETAPCVAPLAETEDLLPEDEKDLTPEDEKDPTPKEEKEPTSETKTHADDEADVSQSADTSKDSHGEQKRNDICPWEDE